MEDQGAAARTDLTSGDPSLGAGRCPFCEASSRPVIVTRDWNRRCSREEFEYRRCFACGTLFLGNLPLDLGRYYPTSYYQLPDANGLARLARGERFKLEFILPWVRSGRLVEIGAGQGTFAWLAREAGFETVAVEMDQRSCIHLRQVVGVPAIESGDPAVALANLPSSRVITLWHTLEHLSSPRQVLQAAAVNLEPGGLLVIAVPNPDSFGLRLLRSRWPHLDAPRHLNLIPSRALTQVARGLGLEPVEVSTTDRGARGWNEFGWRHALVPINRRGPARYAAYAIGKAACLLLAPLECTGSRGSTYTVVFRKHVQSVSG